MEITLNSAIRRKGRPNVYKQFIEHCGHEFRRYVNYEGEVEAWHIRWIDDYGGSLSYTEQNLLERLFQKEIGDSSTNKLKYYQDS